MARSRPTRTGVDRRAFSEVLDAFGRPQVVRTADLEGPGAALALHDRFGRPYPPPGCATDAPASMLRSNVAVVVGPLFRASGADPLRVQRARAVAAFREQLLARLRTGAGLLLAEARQAVPGISQAQVVGALAGADDALRFPLTAHADLAFVLDESVGQGTVAIAATNALERAFIAHRIGARIGVPSLRVSVYRGACSLPGIPLVPIRLPAAA